MSVITTSKTNSTSILKEYTPINRKLLRTNVKQQRVHFELPKFKLKELLANEGGGGGGSVGNNGHINRNGKDCTGDTAGTDTVDQNDANNKFDRELSKAYAEYIFLIQQNQLNDDDFVRILTECKDCFNQLKIPTHSNLIESCIALNWLTRPQSVINEYQTFLVDLLTIHNFFLSSVINRLITYWIPMAVDVDKWNLGKPNDELKCKLKYTHELLNTLLKIIPMSYDIISESIELCFPFYGTSTFIFTGYVSNVLWLLKDNPMFKEDLLIVVIRRLILLDVNAPKGEIENSELEDDVEQNEEMFDMDTEIKQYGEDEMHLQIAETLDICMTLVFEYIEDEFRGIGARNINSRIEKIYKLYFYTFETTILTTHKTHHIQFFMFYLCSFKSSMLSELFLTNLYDKFCNPNISAVIRQYSVNYLGSYLARSKSVTIEDIKSYLLKLRSWTGQYIERCDLGKFSESLRIHSVFYSVCQTIFYLIAFRSRDLTSSKSNLMFLQNLQLSSLVTCQLNPLRVCIPAISTAFASVTRAYQLAYCHTILERNARNKLATIYANGSTQMPNEFLDSYFPFDPYLLKKSGKIINPIYMQYQANEAEEDVYNNTENILLSTVSNLSVVQQNHATIVSNEFNDAYELVNNQQLSPSKMHNNINPNRRKFNEIDDNYDDFIIPGNNTENNINYHKKTRLSSVSRSYEIEMEFNYSTSPGFK